MVSTALAVASGIFRENKHRSWSRAANLAVMRYLFNQKWDIYTLQSFIGATTTQVYQAWAAQEKIEALTDILPEKAKLHWVGPRQEGSQGRVLLYFFGEVWPVSVFCTFTDLSLNVFAGGAFCLPPRPDYFPFLHAIQKAVSASSDNFSIAALEHCEQSRSLVAITPRLVVHILISTNSDDAR